LRTIEDFSRQGEGELSLKMRPSCHVAGQELQSSIMLKLCFHKIIVAIDKRRMRKGLKEERKREKFSAFF